MADTKSGGPMAAVKDTVAGNPAVDRLKEEAVSFAAAQAQRLLVSTCPPASGSARPPPGSRTWPRGAATA
ncbi:hypothetical protein [Streptomyces monomycini]|uniref:hypothetical protein n=1 Tax=Streptomyces monomycini TaxID=371720 RepID=UPI001FCBB355|nr:hypothetical protein [Streptomyces monomycini]